MEELRLSANCNFGTQLDSNSIRVGHIAKVPSNSKKNNQGTKASKVEKFESGKSNNIDEYNCIK